MKLGKILFNIVKILVVIISISYVLYKLHEEYQRGIFAFQFSYFNTSDILFITLALILVSVNWILESVKFKLLVKPIQYISLKNSLKGVLAGVTVSIFTPKRLGEFGGRVFILSTENRLNGIFATLLGNLSQLLITLIMGVMFFPIYWSKNSLVSLFVRNYPFFIPLVLTLLILLLIMYLYMNKLALFLAKLKFFLKHRGFILFLQHYKKTELLKILGLSLLRYCIFTFQFFLLLKFFKVEITLINAFIGVSQIYFFMTIMPTFSLGELGVRGSISVWVLSIFAFSATGIIAASVLLWVINLALPALVGSYYLSKLKY